MEMGELRGRSQSLHCPVGLPGTGPGTGPEACSLRGPALLHWPGLYDHLHWRTQGLDHQSAPADLHQGGKVLAALSVFDLFDGGVMSLHAHHPFLLGRCWLACMLPQSLVCIHMTHSQAMIAAALDVHCTCCVLSRSTWLSVPECLHHLCAAVHFISASLHHAGSVLATSCGCLIKQCTMSCRPVIMHSMSTKF